MKCTTCNRSALRQMWVEDEADAFRWCPVCGTIWLDPNLKPQIPSTWSLPDSGRVYAEMSTPHLRGIYAAYVVDYTRNSEKGATSAAAFCANRMGIIEGVLAARGDLEGLEEDDDGG